MSSEELRRAAALMRERAEAADCSPWSADNERGRKQIYLPDGRWPFRVADVPSDENRDHIASWHPAVALAVADWLEAEAQAHFHIGDEVRSVYDQPNMGGPALVVARAYLGTVS